MFKKRGILKGTTSQRSTVAIKRVLRVGDVFRCGVCRKNYHEEASAKACLTKCLNAHASTATSVVAEGGGKKFRCHFCKRVYTERDKAKACATSCRAQAEKAVVELQASERRSAAPAAAKAVEEKQRKIRAPVRRDQEHKYLRDGRTLVCRKCGKEHPTLDTVIACYDAHPAHVKKLRPEEVAEVRGKRARPAKAAAAPAPTAAAKEAPLPAPAPAKVEDVPAPKPAAAAPASTDPPIMSNKEAHAKLHEDDHKFMRDGAKYVCRTCSKKFFTRSDVVACFEAH